MADTVILGAGINGVSTAYYLSRYQHGHTIHLVDASAELFASGSGCASGFLASTEWFGTGVGPLAELSLHEHERLAQVHDGASNWGYCRSTPFHYTAASGAWLRYNTRSSSGAAAGSATHGFGENGALPPWLRREDGDLLRQVGDEGSTAQLDPLRFCNFLLGECLNSGVHLHRPAKAIALMQDVDGLLSGVRIADTLSSTETDVPCTRLIITAGPWSQRVFAEVSART
jgi:glycine/D-amino acid oxidase-like deaminating enzyme